MDFRKPKTLLKYILCILTCFSMWSCYDYGFKEQQVAGRVYLVYSEGFPEYYTLEYKLSKTNYTILVDKEMTALYKSPSDILVSATDAGENYYYKVIIEEPEEAITITQKEFERLVAACKGCATVEVPKP